MSGDRIREAERKIAALEASPDLKPQSKKNLQTARSSLVIARLLNDAGREREGRQSAQFAELIVRGVILAEIKGDAIRGAKVHQAARDGNTAVYGTAEEKQERREQTKRALAGLQSRNPALSLTDARRKVAKELGISYSTVRRHTEQ
jgi:hypothetical protein